MVQLQSLKCFSNLGNIFEPIFTFYFLENLVFWIDRCSDEKSLGIFVRCIWDKTSLFHVLVAFFGFLAAFKAWIGSLWRKLAEIYLKQSKMGLIRFSCCFQSYFCSFKGKTYPKTCLKDTCIWAGANLPSKIYSAALSIDCRYLRIFVGFVLNGIALQLSISWLAYIKMFFTDRRFNFNLSSTNILNLKFWSRTG